MTFSPPSFESAHTFHIPVMGTGFTIDTPLRIAKYGISSVIPLADDILVEQMRRFHSEKAGEPYAEIRQGEEDVRARRITAYLDLLDRLVQAQVRALQAAPFAPGSEITRYFELLPDSPLQRSYRHMASLQDGSPEKAELQQTLRARAVPGSIDVNIMTKLDRDNYAGGETLPLGFSDALASLRGFARSTLRSSVVCSAGMNQRLYSFIPRFDCFLPDADGHLAKKVVLKVSDARSATVQSKFLAKRGIWVSEYRIESGLNCGGHAFATKGDLLGPILDVFRKDRQSIVESVFPVYNQALKALGRAPLDAPPPVRVTVQGGIGTAEEDAFLLRHYQVDGTGWATPFLLVPEVTNMDAEHLQKLIEAREEDVYLSEGSPLNVPLWNLRTSASEEARRQRIRDGRPGSACHKGIANTNTEFTERPVCISARTYQREKLKQLETLGLSPEQYAVARETVLARTCLCHDLAGVATLTHGIDPEATPSVCCGPNILNFNRVATLEEMVGHIYGRLSLLARPERPHMFVRELMLYVDHLRKETDRYRLEMSVRTPQYIREFRENLLAGIDYYRNLALQFAEDTRRRFLEGLEAQLEAIHAIEPPPAPVAVA